MNKVIIFGGTTEGRRLAQRFFAYTVLLQIMARTL